MRDIRDDGLDARFGGRGARERAASELGAHLEHSAPFHELPIAAETRQRVDPDEIKELADIARGQVIKNDGGDDIVKSEAECVGEHPARGAVWRDEEDRF